MTHSQGFADAAPASQLTNNPANFDQDHITPMDLDSDNDRDSIMNFHGSGTGADDD